MKNLALSFSIIFLAFGICFAQTSAFTYQGKLADSGSPANGQYDFVFKLFSLSADGAQIGADVVRDDVQVTTGVFTVSLDFGSSPFTSDTARYLEIAVRPGASTGAYTTLVPRQPITSSPYSVSTIRAVSAAVADNALQLGGVNASQYVQTADARLSDARTPTAGSTDYIQNTTAQQTRADFNISGTGTANIFNATTQYNIGGSRVLSVGGTDNVFAGVGAGGANTTGSFNSFFGRNAGQANAEGTSNSFFGVDAGIAATSVRNSFFGAEAGVQSSTGFDNAFFGYAAGQSNTVGNANTVIGAFADLSANNLTNATAIGHNARVSQSNSLVLGNGVNVGIGTTAPQQSLHVVGNEILSTGIQAGFKFRDRGSASSNDDWVWYSNTNIARFFRAGVGDLLTVTTNGTVEIPGALDVTGRVRIGVLGSAFGESLAVGTVRLEQLGSAGSTSLCQNFFLFISSCSSSIRYKQNIDSFNQGLSLVKQLRPVSFNWRANNQADFGLVAEEVNKVEPLLTTTNDKGEIEGVKYDRVGVVLVNAVQEQQRQIDAQQKQIERQQKQIDSLKQIVCSMNPRADICK